MNIIYKDEQLVVVDKGFGEISELPSPVGETSGERGAVYTPALLQRALADAGEDDAVYPVHRLDRTTAGLTVYARTREAAASLSRQMQPGGAFEKRYLALTQGKPTEKSGEMRDYLYFDRRRGKSFPAERKRNGTKEAILRYEWLEDRETRWGVVSLIRVALLTGRTHQIRVQFASRGYPLLGDGKYGSRANFKGCALFSCEMRFLSPATGEALSFQIEPETALN